ncbi:AI-2E family transporter [Thermus antranikianii]|uniref:AI-2E family transporter n=1 Tax=Thermus antranikianii TaxID=88190 RepID=A0ABY7RQW8_9DEIN|nr:AI-2E family transporter [Thermus antranikianii]
MILRRVRPDGNASRTPLFLSLALFLWALSHLYSLLLWVFLAFTLAGALDPLVGLFARRFPRPSAVFLAYLMVLGVMGLGFYLAAPLLILQFHHPGELLPMVLQWLQDNLALSLPDLASSLASSAHVAGDLLLRVGETVSEMVLALVLAVMIALEPHLVPGRRHTFQGAAGPRCWRIPGSAWAAPRHLRLR